MAYDRRLRRRRPVNTARGNAYAGMELEARLFAPKAMCLAQHDQNIANDTGAAVRSDINNALAALFTLSSGATEPATRIAHMLWADTTSATLKRRNAANTGWIVVRTLDETFVLSRTSNTILDVSDIGKTIRVTSGTFSQTFDACATLGDGWWVDYINEGTGTVTLDPNGAETIDGVATIVFGPGEGGTIVCNGSNLKVVNRSRYAGAIAAGRNIAARTHASTPLSQLTITADELQLKDANGNVYVATSVNVSPAITGSGANGLDTGAEAGNTWYYGWVIYNPASNTVAGLISTSSTAPTMPSGYSFKALVTAVRNNGSSNFVPYRQFGNWAYYEAQQSALSAGTATTETAIGLTALIPPIAHALKANCRLNHTTDSGNGTTTVDWRYITGLAYAQQELRISTGDDQSANDAQFEFPNISQNIFYIIGGTTTGTPNAHLQVAAFKLPCGGE